MVHAFFFGYISFVNFKVLNPIPTGLGHVTFIHGLIPPMAGRNRVKKRLRVIRLVHVLFYKRT